MPKLELLKPDVFERLVQKRHQSLRIELEARRRLDAEEHPRLVLSPFETLQDRLARPRDAMIWRIERWLPIDARLMLAAQFKSGKTTAVANLIRSLVDGDHWLGSANVNAIDGAVALLDTEMAASQLDQWMADQAIVHGERIYVALLRGRVPDGSPITRDRVIKAVRGAQRAAGIDQGVHILRHTFCSHLAMKGAPARAIQEVAGHADLSTTQRYMHLSPAATEDAIRLLDARQAGVGIGEHFGEMLETPEASGESI
jgi:Phage integrase family/AAA domain